VPESTIAPPLDPRVHALMPDDGPTYDEVRKDQRWPSLDELVQSAAEMRDEVRSAGISHYVIHELTDYAKEAARHLFVSASAAGKVALVGKAIGYLALGYEVTEKVYDLSVKKFIAQGKELAEGLDRDQKNLTLLMIVQVAQPDTLPDGYFRSEVSRVLGTAGKNELDSKSSFKNASVILGKAVTDPEIAHARDILVASTREGVTAAYQAGIDSEARFKELRDTDVTFRTRYASDPAFRAGVNAAVWQATYHRPEFDTAVALSAACRAPKARM
jgi:hypothetical protein